MAQTPDNPIDQTRDGSYQIQGPTVTVTPGPADQGGPSAPAPMWRQVGQPALTSIEPSPGT